MKEKDYPDQSHSEQQNIYNPLNTRISRRQALFWGGILAAAYAVNRVVGPIIDQKYDEWIASMSNEEFINHFKDELQKVRFGASFAPEQFRIGMYDQGREDGRFERAMEGLRFGIEDIGMKSIRMGIRWNNSVDRNGNIDFSFYEPFMDYLVSKGVRVCPNFGYKVLRWPEQHPPRGLVNLGVVPEKGSEITPETEFGKSILGYTDRMAAFLQKKYGDIFPTVQIENEPMQKFGEYEHEISQLLLSEDIAIARHHFPSAQILLNAGGAKNVEKTAQFIEAQIGRNPKLQGILKLGIDLHFQNPKVPRVIRKITDTFTIDEILYHGMFNRIKERSQAFGYPIEATEVQIEGWGDLQAPLYSVNKMKTAIARTITDVLPIGEDGAICDLRFWGIENQYDVFTSKLVSSDTEKRIALLRDISQIAA